LVIGTVASKLELHNVSDLLILFFM
jgi:hypothetical protein